MTEYIKDKRVIVFCNFLSEVEYISSKVDCYVITGMVNDREEGCLPVVVINKDISNRMASTVRNNRARGSHDIDLMVNIVKELHESGMSDAWILKHLGMDAEELLRLKQISGLASLFKNKEFSHSWE